MFLSLFFFFLSFLQGISSDGNGDIPVGDLQNVLLHERAKAPRSCLRPLAGEDFPPSSSLSWDYVPDGDSDPN
jgi:hypothetical protein